jgi:protein-S-isoprenylcysteine O-methyltransferase Ste14
MTGLSNPSNQMKRGFLGTTLFLVAYFLVALLLLRQWNSPHPWARLDIFSGGYLLLAIPWAVATARFHRAIFVSKEIFEEASGTRYDRLLLWGTSAVSLGELSVFVDYARWHLVPALEEPALQFVGLALALAGSLWIFWVDHYLARHFAGDMTKRTVMQDGPYRHVRHPRYLALLVSRIAFALALASILAWISFLGWLWLILHRIRLEDAHLREVFGTDYEEYAARTARLIPGLF